MTARTEADPHLGRTLGGQYRIEALLGYGGMGRVYRGLQLSVNRPVAIKLIAGSAPHPPEWVRRFRREAEATARLSHPNSVRLFDFGVTESEELYMVMELLHGTDLAHHLIGHGPLPLPTALSITRQVLLALCEAHALGITHRDIKPDNIFLADVQGADVVAKVMDFGIAGLARANASAKLTGTGVVIGTPAYMSPEQAQSNPVNGKTDVYALGVVLFEMLTGHPVFESPTALSVLLAHVARQPPRLRELGVQLPQQAGLQSLLDRMLAKDPASRPSAAQALEVVTDLAARSGVAAATGSLRNDAVALRAGPAHAATARGRAAIVQSAHRSGTVTTSGGRTRPLVFAAFVVGAALVVAAASALVMRWVPPLVAAAMSKPANVRATQQHTVPKRKVLVRSHPPAASVYVEGEKRGVTPYELEYAHDTELSVVKEGYVRRLVPIDHATASPLLVELRAEEPTQPDPRGARASATAVATDPTGPPPTAPDPTPTPTPAQAPQRAQADSGRNAPFFFSFGQASAPTIEADDAHAQGAGAEPERRYVPPPTTAETSRAAATQAADPRQEQALDDAALEHLDDEEQAHLSKHHGLRVFGRVLARAVGRLLIPYPDRERREALAGRPLAYTGFHAARRAYKRREIDRTGFEEAVWQLRERRRRKIQQERDRYARGELSQEQYEIRLDHIWDEFWGTR